MAGTITYDGEGSTFSSGQNGDVWSRVFVCNGLNNGPGIPDLIAEAFVLTPNQGTAAPAPIVNMYVREVNFDRFWCEYGTSPQQWACRGTIIYTTPTRAGGTIGIPEDDGVGVSISSTSTVQEIETARDRDGEEISTTFDNVTMTHLARTFEVGRSFSYRRAEVSSPRARQTNHEATLNDSVWNGYAAETVLCQTIDWSTDDFGASYVVDYTFVYRPDGWQFTAIHEDPYFPGRPVPGATGEAVKTADLIPTSNFNLLSITLP